MNNLLIIPNIYHKKKTTNSRDQLAKKLSWNLASRNRAQMQGRNGQKPRTEVAKLKFGEPNQGN